jgi:MFS family permease
VFGLLAPWYFAASLTAFAAILVWVKLPPIPAVARKSRDGRAKLRYADPRIVRYVAAAIGMFSGFGAIQQTLGFSIQDKLQLTGIETAQHTGAAFMISASFAFISQWVLIQRLKLAPEQFILCGLGTLLLAAGFIGSFDSFGYLGVGMAFMGAGMGLAMPSISAAASLAVAPEEQGAVAGLIASTPAIGFVTGPLIGGLLYQFSPVFPSAFSGTVFVLVFVMLRLTRSRTA